MQNEVLDCEFYKPRIRDKYGYGACEIRNLQGDFHNICQHPDNKNCLFRQNISLQRKVAQLEKEKK